MKNFREYIAEKKAYDADDKEQEMLFPDPDKAARIFVGKAIKLHRSNIENSPVKTPNMTTEIRSALHNIILIRMGASHLPASHIYELEDIVKIKAPHIADDILHHELPNFIEKYTKKY